MESIKSWEIITQIGNLVRKGWKKISELNPTNSKILIELYACYVEISDLENKVQCLKKLCDISPNDFYPFQQLADIYLNELNDENTAKIYQNKANNLNNNF